MGLPIPAVMDKMTDQSDLTPKQEAFALAYLETGNAAEAYRRAYDVEPAARDSWVYVEACQLLDHPKIAPRIAELRQRAEKLTLYSKQKAFEEYEEARAMAMREGSAAAAVSAVSGKVKLFGLDAPARARLEHQGPNGGPIKTEEVGAGQTKLATFLDAISSRTTGSAE